ncbi:MAG TPA: hypothetical protein VIN75_14655 [Burkholderiaceae bacterium]
MRLLLILIASWFAAAACHAELPTIEAIERQPDHVQAWQSRENYLEPKWGGRLEDVIALAELGHRTVSPGEGRGMMVEVLEIGLDCNCSGLLNHPGIDWEAVRASMDDVLQRYPDEINAQRCLLIACKRADKALAQHLVPWVKAAPSPFLTDGNVGMFEQRRAWTQGRKASFGVFDAATGRTRIVQ